MRVLNTRTRTTPSGRHAHIADAETVQLVHEEVCNLPERLRLPLILCGWQGASREQAASKVIPLVLVAGGKAILSGVNSANAAALTQKALISMKNAKLKTAALVALGLVFVVVSSGVIAYTVKEMLATRKPAPALDLQPQTSPPAAS